MGIARMSNARRKKCNPKDSVNSVTKQVILLFFSLFRGKRAIAEMEENSPAVNRKCTMDDRIAVFHGISYAKFPFA